VTADENPVRGIQRTAFSIRRSVNAREIWEGPGHLGRKSIKAKAATWLSNFFENPIKPGKAPGAKGSGARHSWRFLRSHSWSRRNVSGRLKLDHGLLLLRGGGAVAGHCIFGEVLRYRSLQSRHARRYRRRRRGSLPDLAKMHLLKSPAGPVRDRASHAESPRSFSMIFFASTAQFDLRPKWKILFSATPDEKAHN
jgi:hypothetical protein